MKAAYMNLFLVAPLLGACVSTSADHLRSEAETDLAGLCESWEALPRNRMLVPTRIGDGPTVDVSIYEIGDPSSERLNVMVHGVNANHRSWRFVVGALGEEQDTLLVDLPGCGNSDCPDPRALGPNGYSPSALGERVLQALEAYLADRETKPKITLVAHSLGGAISMRMMGSLDLRARYGETLERIDRMVLFAPADIELVNPSPALLQLAEVSGIEVDLANLLGILRSKVDKSTVESVVNPERALRETARSTRSILSDADTRLALQAMLLQAIPRLPDGELDWPVIQRLVADYANIEVPCLIVWGRRDATLPVSMGYKLAAQIPSAELYVLEECKHSAQLEFPELCADIIRRFEVVPDQITALERETVAQGPAVSISR
jgi:pimeloyl-ACP methyl ester carboxylesterase